MNFFQLTELMGQNNRLYGFIKNRSGIDFGARDETIDSNECGGGADKLHEIVPTSRPYSI